MNKKSHQPSEGEVFLADYFNGEGISFTSEELIEGLVGDTKSFRKADFYLDNFNIYVEFYGMWNNSKKDRERYREKKIVYYKNKIPCVYLYPENLGIIEFSFPRRAIQEFKRCGMKKELVKFRMKYLWLYKQGNIVFLLITLYILLFGTFTWERDQVLIVAMIGIVLYQVYNIQNWFSRHLLI